MVERSTNDAAAGGQFATFFLNGYLFGIEVLQVQEVLRSTSMTRVPLGPNGVEGLINLRGQIVTAIDLRTRLGFPPRGSDESAMNMVVRSDDGAVSLLVDEIGDVVDVEADAFERPPDNIDATTRDLVTGIFKLKDRLLLVLDTKKALAVTAASGSRKDS